MLPTLRGWDLLGARERISLPTLLNWSLVMMAVNACSTRTGSAWSLAFTPQSIVPVYASLVRMPWTLVLPQSFPLGLAMPSSLRVLVMFYAPTALLKNMTAMLTGRQKERPEDLAIPGEQRHVCVDRKI